MLGFKSSKIQVAATRIAPKALTTHIRQEQGGRIRPKALWRRMTCENFARHKTLERDAGGNLQIGCKVLSNIPVIKLSR